MKLASIVPVKQIVRTYDGDYAMLLAHMSGYYPLSANKNCYRIMDNSLIELGGAVDINTVYDAAVRCDAHEFILPDVFTKGLETVERVAKDIEYLKRMGRLHDFRLMAVCHGGTIDEFCKCFYLLSQMPEIHSIGIPKVSRNLTKSGRPGLEELWRGSSKAIHLLGCWDSLDEFRQYKDPASIRSCDTCIPSLFAREGVRDIWGQRPVRTIDLYHDNFKDYIYNDIRDELREAGLV